MVLCAAVKVADKMQRTVTEKRGEIDSLQSRLRWLEECMETANKVCTICALQNFITMLVI